MEAIGLLYAIRAWRLGGRALVVVPDGRVTYGGAALVGAGESRKVVEEERGSDDGSPTYHVSVLRGDGSAVGLPSPYFTELDDLGSAVWLVVRLGEMLGVPAEGVSPGEAVSSVKGLD